MRINSTELDWDKPVQWSTGEEITFAPYDDSMPNHHVSACAEWVKITGDSFVAVDDEGLIMGCEDELYPSGAIANARYEGEDIPDWLDEIEDAAHEAMKDVGHYVV